jgi:nucleotide-binding universal stress UspA family protein
MNTLQHQRNRTDQLGVVVGVDGSRIGLDAVRWAVAEAHLRGVPLQILHAAPYSAGSAPGMHRAGDILDRACTVAHGVDPTLPVTSCASDQAATQSLLNAGRHAQLLVVGMRDQPQEVLIGSVALDVSQHAPCPVAVVRRGHPTPTDGPVLVGVNHPATDAAALTWAFSEAQLYGGRVVILHARPAAAPFCAHLTGHADAARATPWEELVNALSPWSARFPDVPVELTIVPGQPTTALLAAASAARLVVVGNRGCGAPARALFSSTSRGVLRRSPVPVVVVNADIVLPSTELITAAAAPQPVTTSAEDPHDHGQPS